MQCASTVVLRLKQVNLKARLRSTIFLVSHSYCIVWLRDLQLETFGYLARRRKGLIIDLSDEYMRLFAYVQRILMSAEVLFFPPENSTIASGEVNSILFITIRAFQ